MMQGLMEDFLVHFKLFPGPGHAEAGKLICDVWCCTHTFIVGITRNPDASIFADMIEAIYQCATQVPYR
jgi:hypothetical protein